MKRFNTYRVKVGDTYYLIGFGSEIIEKIFDYYKVEYEKVESTNNE